MRVHSCSLSLLTSHSVCFKSGIPILLVSSTSPQTYTLLVFDLKGLELLDSCN